MERTLTYTILTTRIMEWLLRLILFLNMSYSTIHMSIILCFRNRDRQRMSKVGEVQATLLRQAAKEEQEERERNRKAGNDANDDSEEVDGEVRGPFIKDVRTEGRRVGPKADIVREVA